MLEAFVAAGFLTPEEAGEQPSAAPSLFGLTDDELLTEVARRMREGGTNVGTTAASGKSGLRALPTMAEVQRAKQQETIEHGQALPSAASHQDDGLSDPDPMM